MPTTRAQAAGAAPPPPVSEGENLGRGRGRRRRTGGAEAAAGGAPRDQVIDLEVCDLINRASKITFQEVDNSLHHIQGCYGTWDHKKGFARLTNILWSLLASKVVRSLS